MRIPILLILYFVVAANAHGIAKDDDDDRYSQERLMGRNDYGANDDGDHGYGDKEIDAYIDDATPDDDGDKDNNDNNERNSGRKNIDRLSQSSWEKFTGSFEYIRQKTHEAFGLFQRFYTSSPIQSNDVDAKRKLDRDGRKTESNLRRPIGILSRMKEHATSTSNLFDNVKRDSNKRVHDYLEEHSFSLPKNKNPYIHSISDIVHDAEKHATDILKSKDLSKLGAPLIPLEAPPPQSKDEEDSNEGFTSKYDEDEDEDAFSPELNFKYDEILSVEIGCSYTDDDGATISCDSSNFTELEVDACILNVTYTYFLSNNGARRVRVYRLMDQDFQDIVEQSVVVRPNARRSVTLPGQIDICSFTEVEKKAIAMASRSTGSGSQSLPYSRDEISFLTPLLPFELGIEQVSCEIDDDSGTTCEQFLRRSDDTNECVADIRFNYTFANIGLPCVDIVAIKAELGPLERINIDFEDVYSYSERQMCSGQFWTIPDRRESVDLCRLGIDIWHITIDVDEIFGRTTNMTVTYDWSLSPTMSPTDGAQPFAAPSSYPSSAPSFDACLDCTLTGIVSGASRVKLWGSGKENISFQGVCDIIAIDNPLLQLQIRTRRGRNAPLWSGVVELALKWKKTGVTVFRFVGNDRMEIDNTASLAESITYTTQPNPRLLGRTIHIFQFNEVEQDNYIRVEEMPYGLHNIEVKGFGSTFGGSAGFVGSWERWSRNPRILLRDESLYAGFNALVVAQSWRVLESESLMKEISDVCENDVPCGPTESLQCVEDSNEFRFSKQEECLGSCDDISDPLLRNFCHKDVETTGYRFFECQSIYLDSAINESFPPECPSDCIGDATRGNFFIAELGREESCEWALEVPQERLVRCALEEVAANCCESCCTTCKADAAGTEEFEVVELGETHDCAWVFGDEAAFRCSFDSVLRMCCVSCAIAVPSESPSSGPSISISVPPTGNPSAPPSNLPSQAESSSPSAVPSGAPSSRPTLSLSNKPSSKPSDAPTSNPSKASSQTPTLAFSENPTGQPTKKPTKSPTKTPSKSPSSLPSVSPTIIPTLVPSALPSFLPSFLPTFLPSSRPSQFEVCPIEGILGETISFAVINMCFQVEVVTGGELSVDVTDSDCSSSNFNSTATISTFRNVTSAIDRVYYDGADLGWSGYFDFKESSLVTEIQVGFPIFDLETLEYGIEVFLPNCYPVPDRRKVF